MKKLSLIALSALVIASMSLSFSNVQAKAAVKPVAYTPSINNNSPRHYDFSRMPTVQRYSTGYAVSTLQSALNQVRSKYNISNYGYVKVDGDFGKDTYNAVTSFQVWAGLSVDGIVGPNTWKSLENLLNYDLY